MKFAVDLHIHSALSPCADKDMTPNNIVNMARVKGLDFIALTDHNSGANLEAVDKCAKKTGLIFIPGMEVETSEEVHLVCLLPDLESAAVLHRHVYNSLPSIKNREDIFGKQLIMDEYDRNMDEEGRMLIMATLLNVNEVFLFVNRLGGVVLPAHVDRLSNGMISNLGMIPEDLGIRYLEISRNCSETAFRTSRPELDSYGLIRSSDAHYLGDILEREMWLELEERSPRAVIEKLKKGPENLFI